MAKKPGQLAAESENAFRVELQPRHAAWVRNVCRANHETPQQLLERLIRMAYAGDRTKGGTISGGGTVLAKDFNEG